MKNKERLNILAKLIKSGQVNPYQGELKVGVDLGTANLCVVVLDENNNPIAGTSVPSKVVRDGIVVDYVGAVKIVKGLKKDLEEKLEQELNYASCAIPPGILPGNVKVISNVVENSGFEVINVVDEPVAAATVFNIKNGAVVDIGGGTTGISILKDGEVIFTADEPTGGYHMTLTLAGYYDIDIDKAETIKIDKSKESEVYPVIQPVVEKMAYIVKNFTKEYSGKDIYVVGGACLFNDFSKTFKKILNKNIIIPDNALIVTPLGIAMNCIGG